MDKITKEVTKLQGELHTSRSQLRVLERVSKKDIAAKVDAIRPPIASSQLLIGTICADYTAFVARIEAATADPAASRTLFAADPTSPSAGVLAEVPSKLWGLRHTLDNLVGFLEDAHKATATAISTTDDYALQVTDVGQKIEIGSVQLARCQSSAATLAAQARRDLDESRAALKRTQAELADKRDAVSRKKREVQELKEQKQKLERQIEEKNREAAAAERERSDRKEQAVAAGVVSGIGLIAAPFTLGLSLLVAAPAAVTAGYKAGRATDFAAEARSLRAQASALDNTLSASLRATSTLEAECSTLERLITSHKSAITSHTTAQASHARQLDAAASASSEILSLQAHAAATKRSVAEALPELRGVRDALEGVSVAVKEKALAVETAAPGRTWGEKVKDMRPGQGGPAARRRRRELERQLGAVRRVTEMLERVGRGLPGLLEGGSERVMVKGEGAKVVAEEVRVVEVGDEDDDAERWPGMSMFNEH